MKTRKLQNTNESFTHTKSNLIQALTSSCQQSIACIASVDDKLFTLSYEGHSSMGAHTRHIIDRMNCLIDGITNDTVVDYDKRERQPEIEQSRTLARQNIEIICKFFTSFETAQLDNKVSVKETISTDGEHSISPSSIAREILDLINHNTHHLAIIKLLLSLHGVDTDSSMGKTASTRLYEKRVAAS